MGSLSRKIKRNSELRATSRYVRKCPGCNDDVTLASTDEGPMVLHKVPYCNYFIHTEADEFCREVFPEAYSNMVEKEKKQCAGS